ncbi:MAG: hypothetical protein JST92_10115 [Deltaproteobacteria bacterium]|nr:hypothetical protein [Deltaproteobacteria bacterium]
MALVGGCGGADTANLLSPDDAEKSVEMIVPSLPTMPPPISYREWGDRRFFNADQDQGWVQITLSPDDRTHFRAYVVDVRRRAVTAQIDGVIAEDLGRFSAQVAANYAALGGSSLDESRGIWGSGSEWLGPPPRPGGPGGDGPLAARMVAIGTAYVAMQQIALAPAR